MILTSCRVICASHHAYELELARREDISIGSAPLSVIIFPHIVGRLLVKHSLNSYHAVNPRLYYHEIEHVHPRASPYARSQYIETVAVFDDTLRSNELSYTKRISQGEDYLVFELRD